MSDIQPMNSHRVITNPEQEQEHSKDEVQDLVLLLGYKSKVSDAGVNIFVIFMLLTLSSIFSMSFGNVIGDEPNFIVPLAFFVPISFIAARLLAQRLGVGARIPSGSLLISTSSDELTVRYGYPTPTKEVIRQLSKIDALELCDAGDKGSELKIYARMGPELIRIPSSQKSSTCHDEATSIARILDRPIFRLKGEPTDIYKQYNRRLPYFTPQLERPVTATELTPEERANYSVSLEANFSIEGSHCPYCGVLLKQENTVVCASCNTPHHHECFETNGVCTVYSCNSSQYVIYSGPAILQKASG